MLNFCDLSLRRGKRLLFTAATFSLFRGEKVGITGENGSGKSSLLALVAGELTPEAGSFDMPALAVAHVAQELSASDREAVEFVLDGDAELRALAGELALAEHADDGARLGELHARYAAIGGYDALSRAAQLMHGLGFQSADERRPVSAFSGGWRVRLNLAQALMCRSDLLLLDEPTNHLDLDAIVWLEGWLRDYPGTLLLISHDREFLDRVATRVVNIEHGRARAYRGNYSAFEQQRSSELAEQGALYARQQREIRHMQSFVERFRAKASKARQAQSRLKALERMQRIAAAHVDSSFEFSFAPPEELPQPLLALEQQAAGYEGRCVVEGLSLTIGPGDRLALLGRNGAGKSTVMKLLAGVLPALSGTRTEARDLRIGYFAQHQLEQLLATESPFEHLRQCSMRLGNRTDELALRDFLAGFGFRGDRVFEPVAPFSGGEKARLVLALLAYQRPNLLLLDEPTNHLDLEMRQALAVALQDYTGAVVLVSHDRHLLRVVADELLLIDAGRALPFEGDLDEYARWLARASPPRDTGGRDTGGRDAVGRDTARRDAVAGEAVAAARPGSESPASAAARRQRKRLQAEQRAAVSPLRAALNEQERELERLLAERTQLETQLAAPHAGVDRSRLLALLQQQGRLRQAIEEAESEWLRMAERLEVLAAGQQSVD
jgi:ATP-binding cassette subfamily F protein 3